ncbi:hypothetical protein U8P80_36240 (plasmid) [Rhizobium beringeri]|nr:hypothetical protein U8P80_36240 [Rhizobium beringeri]WSH18679.1 hypothetical protein U8P74_36240 [Rhizobium beringeri]WSH29688.1 hypothetical protein U8P75_25775 [Rhizobium beringeri]
MDVLDRFIFFLQSRIQEHANHPPAVRNLKAEGVRGLGQFQEQIEVRLWQVPLINDSASRGHFPQFTKAPVF